MFKYLINFLVGLCFQFFKRYAGKERFFILPGFIVKVGVFGFDINIDTNPKYTFTVQLEENTYDITLTE